MSLPDRVREDEQVTHLGTDAREKLVAAPVAAQRHLVAPGTLVADKFRVVRLLGGGAMGQVFLARQELIERPVALKVLHVGLASEIAMAQRFHFEAVAASKIRHPNVAMIYDYGEFAGTLYLAMEYVEGETLQGAIRRLERVPVRMAMDVAAQVVAALGAAHEQGVLHRDVKPANILLTSGENGLGVKVVDFGVAKLLDRPNSVLTQTGLVVGTPEYMAPEHAGGKTIDATADLYALGVVLYEMLEGRLPFLGRSRVETSVQHIKDPVPALGSHVPRPLADLVYHLLEKKAPDRPQTASEVIRALNRIAVILDPNAPQPPTVPIEAEVSVDERYRKTEQISMISGPANLGEAGDPSIDVPLTAGAPVTVRLPIHTSEPITVKGLAPVTREQPVVESQPEPMSASDATGAGGLFALLAVVLLALGVVTLVSALVLLAIQ